MHFATITPNLDRLKPTPKKPSKEAYDSAFDELSLLLLKQYRKKKNVEQTEPQEVKIDI